MIRVGVVSWNCAGHLDACLAALPAALEGAGPWEVVVVDNASTDGSAEVAAAAAARVVRNPANVGYPTAMDRALTDGLAACVDVLIALNPDTVAAPGSLTLLCGLVRGPDRIGLAAPRLRHPDGTGQHSVHAFPGVRNALAAGVPPRLRTPALARRHWLVGPRGHPLDRAEDIDWAEGAVHVLRRDAVLPADPGPDDRVYAGRSWHYAEDLALCWRLARAGWRRRFEPSAVVEHVGNVSGEQAFDESARTLRYLDATHDFVREERGRCADLAWTLACLAVLLPRPHRRDLRTLRRAHLAALRGRVGWSRRPPA